jgi:hypothetical protein
MKTFKHQQTFDGLQVEYLGIINHLVKEYHATCVIICSL